MQSAQRKYDYEVSSYPAKKRVVKMQGNVAYISIDPKRPATKAKSAVKARPAQKKQVKTQAKSKSKANAVAKAKAEAMRRERAQSRRNLMSTIFVVFVAFCALSLMISRYAALCTVSAQNIEIEENIETLEAQIDQLALDMELQDSVEDVQSEAQDVLGMDYPRQDQKITIDMSG